MDVASTQVAIFLFALQQGQERLRDLWNCLSARGVRPQRPHLVLSGRPCKVHEAGQVSVFDGSVSLGLIVTGADDKEYDLGVEVFWDDSRWTITAEVWVENEQGGQTLLQELPRRSTDVLPMCLAQMQAAIEDLFQFVTLVPVPGTQEPKAA